MASGNLVQSMSLQQQLSNNVAIVSSGRVSFNNQVLCRPVNLMKTLSVSNGSVSEEQAKSGATSGNDWLKSSDTAALSSCMSSNQSNQTMDGAVISALNNNHTIGAHQIAIQVICQDGTSLVLSVSAASGLNAGLGSTSNQQLQAINNQIGDDNGLTISDSQLSSQTSGGSIQTTGIAASSHTLAPS